MKTMKSKLNFSLLSCLLLLFAFTSIPQAAVIQMERQEVIQRSNMIFEGDVLEKKARWNEMGNLIVTDYVFAVYDVLLGEVADAEITLTFAGGQIGDEGQSLSDVPEFNVGDHVLLMLEESDIPLLSPITGSDQGKFVAGEMVDSNAQTAGQKSQGSLVAFDGENQAVRDDSGNVMAFEDFVEMVRDEIPDAKSKALPDRSVPSFMKDLAIEDLPYMIYDNSSVKSSETKKTIKLDTSLPESKPEADHSEFEDSKENDSTDGAFDVDDDSFDVEGEDILINARPQYWSRDRRWCNTPIVFNQLAPGGTQYLHDQYMMSYWNKYANNLFRVLVNPPGTWAWGNGRNDIAGWVNNATMISQFGQGWGSSTLAVCWTRWNGSNCIVEADIAMNPAFSWTTVDCNTYYNSNLYNTHRTFLHELGHAWGANHSFNALSVMNYAPKKFRAYTQLQADDTMGLRDAYPARAVSRTDIGVYGYYANGFQNYTDSGVSPTSVNAGSTVTVTNFVIENSGTNTVSPLVNWYLVPNICSFSGSRYIGRTTHSSLARDSFFRTSRTLTIPSSIPAGNYYLAASVASSDSVSENNRTWIDRRITVVNPCSAQPLISPRPGSTLTSNSVTFTGGHVSGDLQHWIYVGTAGVGSANILNRGLGTGHSITVSGLPNSGTIYVRYWTRCSSGWLSSDHTYQMNVCTAQPLISPRPGSTLTSNSVTFTGGHGSGDLQHWIQVGTTGVGSRNILSRNLGTGHSTTVSGLPNSGTLYVRYWTRCRSGWLRSDHTYQMNVCTAQPLISPRPGSTLTSNSVTFTGGHGSGDLQHWIYVGTTGVGSRNILSRNLGTGHSTTVSGLPNSGTLYVRYWTRCRSGWLRSDHTYQMNVCTAQPLISPTPGSTLTSNSVTFTGGHGSGDLQHWIQVGTTGVGSRNILSRNLGTGHSTTVSGLPKSGTIYVRYWTRCSSGWLSSDHTYQMRQ